MEKSVKESLIQQLNTVWIFGYGSLTWNPNFIYRSKKIGFIRGYVRRFWQGNTTQRGTTEKPGRVATLVEESEGQVWGVAYEVEGHEHVLKALGYLNNRETQLGGYTTIVTNFYARGHSETDQPINVLLYSATSENSLYMGPCDMNNMAEQIVKAKGFNGPNTDYVTKLADFVKQNIPEDKDHHLFLLDRLIRNYSRSRETRLNSHVYHEQMNDVITDYIVDPVVS